MHETILKPYWITAHVYSQLVFRYIHPERINSLLPVEKPEKILGWDKWTRSEWQDFIEPLLKKFEACMNGKSSEITERLLVHKIYSYLKDIKEAGGKILTYICQEYPESLRQITNPPLALSTIGFTHHLKSPAIAIVGSRKSNSHAISSSFTLGQCLNNNLIATISGGAYGCDAASHWGTLASHNSCQAVVVFAGGLISLQPQGNRSLFAKILESGGLIISERLPTAKTKPFDYPIRNRIIAGLSRATVIMQASMRSGTMTTANYALDQGKEVLVLKHHLENESTSGSKQLVEDGALTFNDNTDFMNLLGRYIL